VVGETNDGGKKHFGKFFLATTGQKTTGINNKSNKVLVIIYCSLPPFLFVVCLKWEPFWLTLAVFVRFIRLSLSKHPLLLVLLIIVCFSRTQMTNTSFSNIAKLLASSEADENPNYLYAPLVPHKLSPLRLVDHLVKNKVNNRLKTLMFHPIQHALHVTGSENDLKEFFSSYRQVVVNNKTIDFLWARPHEPSKPEKKKLYKLRIRGLSTNSEVQESWSSNKVRALQQTQAWYPHCRARDGSPTNHRVSQGEKS
jgi:hypothetical protein